MALFFLLATAACAHLPERPPRPASWESHRVCGPDTRPGTRPEYCLEVIHLGPGPRVRRAVALLVPGMFQSGRIFDLWPERGISFARFLQSQGIDTWVLHVRGIGASDYPPRSNLDDLAIDDLPRAIAWLRQREGEKILVIGHSQGAMTLKASLAGLARCEDGPCFDPKIALARQAQVRAAGFFAGNVALSGANLQLRVLACAGGLLGGLPGLVFDRFRGRRLALWANDHLPAALFDGLNLRENVPPEVRRAMINRAVDGTTAGNLRQFADALAFGATRSGTHRWTDALENIVVPVVQVTFERDPLSPPRATYRDDFLHIGARDKHFIRVRGQAHGDFQLFPAGHLTQLRAVALLLGRAALPPPSGARSTTMRPVGGQ